MDRRTKFILLIVASAALLAAVGWFIVWPTLKPLFPANRALQPPTLPDAYTPPIPQIGGTPNVSTPPTSGGTGGTEVVTFSPSSPDAEQIALLAQRAGVLAERVESGASSDGFSNLSDAQLGVSPALANALRDLQEDLRQAYPQNGALYVTTARRLTARGESDALAGTTFRVFVQMHVTTQDMAQPSGQQQSVAYRQATVTFTDIGSEWIVSGYSAEPFTP